MAYLPLSTANLPDPVIDPAQDASPEDYFNTILYTGNGSARSISGVGFSPDFIWFKARNWAHNPEVYDIVRGTQKGLMPSTNNSEFTRGVTSFDADGFSLDTSVYTNQSGVNFVAWNWKANGSGVSNTDGSITSTVSANTTSGFSIVTWTGNNTDGATVGHGLNQTLDLCIPKSRDVARNWPVKHSALSGENSIFLNLTDGASVTGAGNITFDATDTFTLNRGPSSSLNINGSGEDYIAYCFHSVDGFSKFGSYVGNGSTDGPFVYTGFRPAFVLFKKTNITTASWAIRDNTRYTYNPTRNTLYPDKSDAEYTGTAHDIDFLSNGFKPRTTDGLFNSSGATYIYMAFAENPFKFSTAS